MRTAEILYQCLTGLIPVLGLAFVLSLFNILGTPMVMEEFLGIMLGLGTAAVLLRHPVGERAGAIDIALALIGLAAWLYMAVRYDDWILDAANRPFAKWGPAALAMALLLRGLWTSCGRPIAILFGCFILYGLFGHHIPGEMQAFYQKPEKLAIYLYADSNGIPGAVLRVVCTIVLVFVIFGKLLELTGASAFLTDLAMSLLGRKRGGPAKVAILASAAFGSINGTTVGNIISTGVVTIPLMKKNGFKARDAGAIEAVASNGGQIAPPIMGATAFLIADFLQIPYSEVVLAATVPAVLYFLGLFIQVDVIATRQGMRGLKASELPQVAQVMRVGWVYLIPIALLVWLLIGRGYEPARAGIYASLALLLLALVRFRRLPSLAHLREAVVGSGEAILPLVMIGGGAGIAIGVLNISGLGFQLAAGLAGLAESSGLFVMLVVTALVCIVLGMGMPTSAVYIVLSIVLAPSIVGVGVEPLAAHLFLFYFGLLSMLTPPVAVASYVAANIAGASMWATGMAGLRFAAVGFILPFIWVYNPALIGVGTAFQVGLAIVTALLASALIAFAMAGFRGGLAARVAVFAAGIGVAGSTVWFAQTVPAVFAVCLVAALLVWVLRRRALADAETIGANVPRPGT